MSYDLLVKNCRLVRPDRIVECSVGVKDGRVAALLDISDSSSASRVIDAAGRHVIPGIIDSHVHMGNAGNPVEQDLRTESRSAATGGVTSLLVFVLSQPLPGEAAREDFSYDEVLSRGPRIVQEHSLVDIKWHLGILTPKDVPDIPRYAAQYGVGSFKAWMRGKNALNDGLLLEFFRQIASVPGAVAMVHCENNDLIAAAEKRLQATGRQDLAAWSERAPEYGEIESMHRALTLAQVGGVSEMVIVHIGIGIETEFLQRKRWGSVHLTAETCPHYLLLTHDDNIGIAGKVGPPLRSRAQQQALWGRLTDGTMDMVGSDQLTFATSTKGGDLWSGPSGITGGIAMILPSLLTEGVRKRGLPLTRLVELTSTHAAKTFGLYPRKGALDIGSDADMVILDEDRRVTVTPQALNTHSDYTPYEGYQAHGWAATTIARGRVIYDEGQVTDAQGGGQLLEMR